MDISREPITDSFRISNSPTQSQSATVASPCIGVCELNDQKVCIGCFRSSSEIGVWTSASVDAKQQIVENAKTRFEAEKNR